jgi:hypothetical protein
MYPIFNECPICGGELITTQLDCRHCDTKIQGRFLAGPFASLSPEQIDFVELFIRSEGKLTRMQDELSLSYPTIRNRLHEIIRALGYEPGEQDSGLDEDARNKILDQLAKGSIGYEEAMRRLKESEGI